MIILTQSRKDASALKHTIERILGDDGVSVTSLGGVRGRKLCQAIRDNIKPFTIAILGRDSENLCDEDEVLGDTPFAKIMYTRTSKPRNSTLEMLASVISWGKAWIRLDTSWKNTFFLARAPGKRLEHLPVHPEGDSFLLFNKGLKRLLDWSGLSTNASGIGLLFKGPEGVHTLFVGSKPLLQIRFNKDTNSLDIINILNNKIKYNNIEYFLENNRKNINILEKYSIAKILSSGHKAIVPVSGGKDSAASLLLAVKALGPENVEAIYVDTGIDFPQNLEYVRYVTGFLGVNLTVVEAGVDKSLLAGSPLPSPRNRWCTGLKLQSLRRAVNKIIKNSKNDYILVIGDRDAESVRRGRRPIQKNDPLTGLRSVAPLKYWSGAHVEAYVLLNNLRLNPLYEEGFLRLGCYLCFALRSSWEIRILEEMNFYARIASERPQLGKIISRFLSSRRQGAGSER